MFHSIAHINIVCWSIVTHNVLAVHIAKVKTDKSLRLHRNMVATGGSG